MSEQKLLKLEDIKYSYTNDGKEDTQVLKGISAEFRSGKTYAIMGESGSGKTTLISLISGLENLQSGDIKFGGKSIGEIGLNKWRLKYVNIVFQSYNLIPYMTARENVEVAIDFGWQGTGDDAGEKADAKSALKKVGLGGEKADRLVLKLSGGEQQRVAIARAIASHSPIIVADEPTGNLDEETEQKILDIFRELAASGKIIIIVTHSNRVADFADKVYKLRRGVMA